MNYYYMLIIWLVIVAIIGIGLISKFFMNIQLEHNMNYEEDSYPWTHEEATNGKKKD